MCITPQKYSVTGVFEHFPQGRGPLRKTGKSGNFSQVADRKTEARIGVPPQARVEKYLKNWHMHMSLLLEVK